jgi:hypothetical protein
MATLTIRIRGNSIKKVQKLMKELPQHEVEVLQGSATYEETKAQLQALYQDMHSGKNKVISLEELRTKAEKVISAHDR